MDSEVGVRVLRLWSRRVAGWPGPPAGPGSRGAGRMWYCRAIKLEDGPGVHYSFNNYDCSGTASHITPEGCQLQANASGGMGRQRSRSELRESGSAARVTARSRQ